jgi:FMN phosphatase YigB (HAD superfamily)
MTTRYDALFFDSDETIVDFNACQRRAFIALCAQYAPYEDAEDFYDRYVLINAEMWQRHHEGQITKDELRILRMTETFSGCAMDIRALAASYEDLLADEAYLMPNAHQTLARVKQCCRLVVVTYGLGPVHRRRFEKAGLAELLTGIVVSGDKPSPTFRKPYGEIFQDAHDRFAPSVPKDRILMVGDSETTDITGGMAYGIDTCLYAPDCELEAESAATHVMRDWRDLPMIIGLKG